MAVVLCARRAAGAPLALGRLWRAAHALGTAEHARVATLRPLRWLSTESNATMLAVMVERSPQLTPEPTEIEKAQYRHTEELEGLHKVYPSALTTAEEGPDQQRARERMERLVDRDGSREGEGDRTGDERSLDRRLAQRLYLLVQVDGRWRFPQQTWQPPESAQSGLIRAVTAECGDSLATHQMGNAPMGHRELGSGEKLFLWRHLYVSGEVRVPDGADYAWLTKEELAERIDDELAPMAHLCGPFA